MQVLENWCRTIRVCFELGSPMIGVKHIPACIEQVNYPIVDMADPGLMCPALVP